MAQKIGADVLKDRKREVEWAFLLPTLLRQNNVTEIKGEMVGMVQKKKNPNKEWLWEKKKKK